MLAEWQSPASDYFSGVYSLATRPWLQAMLST